MGLLPPLRYTTPSVGCLSTPTNSKSPRLARPFAQTSAPTTTVTAAATVKGDGASQRVVLGADDTELTSTPVHRAWVVTGFSAISALLVKSVTEIDPTSWESTAAWAVSAWGGYAVADLATGVYHWAIDNYGDASTPVFGAQIDAFQGHHRRPWIITQRQFCNNLHALARPAAFVVSPLLVSPSPCALDAFVGVATACVVLSQQFHAWAHMNPTALPGVVVWLQRAGVLVSRKAHAEHHKAPYENNYCIVSGLWNPIVDGVGLFRKLEDFIFLVWGVSPRSWLHQSHSHFDTEDEPSASSLLPRRKYF